MKIAGKHRRDAARLAAASVRTTIELLVGNAPGGLIAGLALIARDLDRQGAGGTREAATLEMLGGKESSQEGQATDG